MSQAHHGHDEDARLMLAFQQNDDERCFDQLFQKYKGPVVNFAFRYTGRREVAEELAQEIFVKCYMAAPRYQPSAKFSTWLFRIARNHCLNEVRRQDYSYRTEQVEESAIAAQHDDPEQQAQARAMQRAVEQALAQLPESQRSALVLSRFCAMSYEEISETMETSVSAVKSLLNRAKGTMIKHLSSFLTEG